MGGSIEDATGRGDQPLYEKEEAAERIAAAAEAARGLSFPFTLTARAENFLVGRPNLADVIERLQAYQNAGADVLYAPGLVRKEDIAAVVSSVDRPLNVLVGLAGMSFSLDTMSNLGVKRVSVGSALARAALGAFVQIARTMRDKGAFEFPEYTPTLRELNSLFGTPDGFHAGDANKRGVR